MDDSNDQPEPGRSQRRSSRGGSGAGFSAARGAGLIAGAVIVGIVLLNAIDDGNSGPVGDGGTSSTTASTNSNETTTTTVAAGTASTAPTTKPAAISPAQVTVLVLNASGRSGVASTLTNTLKAKGYKTLLPNNVSPVRAGTVVDVKEGKTAPCTTMAALIPGAKVQPMPTPPPFVTDADCIVVIGS